MLIKSSTSNNFLEALDNKERRSNLVITGLTEAADETGTTDNEKVLEVAGFSDAVDPSKWEMKRLRQANEHNKRPVHLTVDDQKMRDSLLRVAKNLKNTRGPHSLH